MAPTDELLSKGEQTRQTILRAAVDRFGRDGFRATSVADIARDAGVSGTAAYAYFPNKEALFLAAVDEDIAEVIHGGVAALVEPTRPIPFGDRIENWRELLVGSLYGAVERHALARRLLAGLEPEVTVRVLDTPALNELRKACADQLRREQELGVVRSDIDVVSVANGVVAIMLSLLMSLVQLGLDVTTSYADDIATVFDAALAPPRT